MQQENEGLPIGSIRVCLCVCVKVSARWNTDGMPSSQKENNFRLKMARDPCITHKQSVRDCQRAVNGAAQYHDDKTRANISLCSTWRDGNLVFWYSLLGV